MHCRPCHRNKTLLCAATHLITQVPTGYTSTTPACVTLNSGAVQCTSDLVLSATTALAFVNSDHGTLTLPVTLSSGGLSRDVTVNITLLDEPELPTGVTVVLTGGPLYEHPNVGEIVATLTILDPDEFPQGYSVRLMNNPNGAFAITAVVGNVLSFLLSVANSSAFQFQETYGRRQVRFSLRL
jgi:hypothetical protein